MRLEATVPAALLPDFTAFAGAFAEVVNRRQVYRDVVASKAPRAVLADAAAREREARAELRENAKRIGVVCGY